MKVVFCNQLTEMLGVQLLSAVLKKAGHETALVFEPNLFATGAIKDPKLVEFLSNDDLVVEDILAEEPDLVGFPIEINGFHWACEIAGRLKSRRPDLPIIMGGIHATMCPENVIDRPEVDYVAVGEAEVTLLELADILDGRKEGDPTAIRGIWARDGEGNVIDNGVAAEPRDLDQFPYYDKSIYYDKLPGLGCEYMTTISRGCPYNCTFCFYNAVHDIVGNRKVRLRTPQHVVDELVAAKKLYPQMESVLFHDDIFPVRVRWLQEFAPLYKEQVGLPFACITYPLLVTEYMADLLADAGCVSVIMGVQSLSEESRANTMARYEKNVDIFNAIRRLRERDIFVTCDHILGTPGETLKDQDDALLFYSDADPSVVKPLPLTYLPKTGMTRIAIEQGVISEQDEADAADGYLNSLMFKGSGYEKEFRPYFMMYGLKPILPKSLFVKIVQNGWHRHLGKVPNVSGIDPVVFFVPRLLSGVVRGYDVRSKFLAWRFFEMFQYSMARKLRAQVMGLDGEARKAKTEPTPASRLASKLLKRRRFFGRFRDHHPVHYAPGGGAAAHPGGATPRT
ncbi:MAG: B12-binding domain-containing radical SAM protein [Deltaproteobacteria bacterium]|nr:B12-binding domain-containing radical SAM protein [Deltaproteobacteria bacterium]